MARTGCGSSTCTPARGAVDRVAGIDAAEPARDGVEVVDHLVVGQGRPQARAQRRRQRAVAAADQQRGVELVVAPVPVHGDHHVDVVEEPASSGASAGSCSCDGTWRFRSSGCTITYHDAPDRRAAATAISAVAGSRSAVQGEEPDRQPPPGRCEHLLLHHVGVGQQVGERHETTVARRPETGAPGGAV